jgi:hypothetical protein
VAEKERKREREREMKADQTWPPARNDNLCNDDRSSSRRVRRRHYSAEDVALSMRRPPLLINNYDMFTTTSSKRSREQKDGDVCLVDLVLFFCCAVGVSVGWTGILSALSFFSKAYGKSSFLYFNLAVYLPSLPVAIVQTKYDGQCDFKFGSTTAMFFRGVIAMIGMTVCIGALPYFARNNLAVCVGLTSVIGLCSAVVYGSFYQIASMINSNGWLQACFAMGYQGSGIVVLSCALSVSFDAEATDHQVSIYFISIACLEFASLLCFLVLMGHRKLVRSQLIRRDSEVALARSSTLTRVEIEKDREEEDDGDEEKFKSKSSPPPTKSELEQPLLKSSSEEELVAGNEISYKEIVRYTWPALFALFITVFGALCVLPFYTYVPSSSDNADLSQILFYTKLGSDMLGRPCTVLLRVIHTPRRMVTAALIRLLFLPLFFIYTFGGDVIPKNDTLVTIFVGLFAFSSGFINTVAYQQAPTMIPSELRIINGARVANMINTVFHAAVYGGLLVSFVVFATMENSGDM